MPCERVRREVRDQREVEMVAGGVEREKKKLAKTPRNSRTTADVGRGAAKKR